MHIHPGDKNTPGLDRKINVSESDPANENEEPYQLEITAMQDDESIDLDDALDDDNDNPVSHTLMDAAENSGTQEIRDTQELEGEEKESKDHTGSLSPLYKEA